MKSFYILLLLAFATEIGLAQQTARAGTAEAESAISKAQQQIAAHPKSADAYTSLALALVDRAKQTHDSGLYAQASLAIDQALEISPKNFEAEKARVAVALGRHDFAGAHELAVALNKRVPDDVAVYGSIVDADLALGNYDEAEKAAQWMLNLRPANIPALVRTAELRELFGDHEGAIEVLQLILDSSIASDVENRAWAFDGIGRLELEDGKLEAAESALNQALAISPECSEGLRTMAQLRLSQQRPPETVELLRRAYGQLPRTETLYELGNALQAAGLKKDASETLAEFERKALSQSESTDNANRALVFYYADHAKKPAEALRIAAIEIARRHDVHTLDAYAWALYVNGDYREAKQQMDAVLKVGIREAPVFYHAGQIAAKLGDSAQAQHYLRQAAEMNPRHSGEAVPALALSRFSAATAAK